MSIEYQEDRIALPETWHAVSDVVARGFDMYYRLADPEPLRDADGRYRRDVRGRVALEAFLGLPMETMFDRLDAYRASVAGKNVEGDAHRYREVFAELISFVETFGPIGLGWSRIHRVLNDQADRVAAENWQLALAAAGFQGAGSPPTAGTPVWRVVLREPGQPYIPVVERVTTYPGLSWEERVRLGDPVIPHDDIGMRAGGPIPWARRELAAAVRLADALSSANLFEIRDAIRDYPRNPAFDVTDHVRQSSLAFDWRVANKGMVPSSGWFRPFEVHESNVDWVALGRMVLAEHISLKLSETSVAVGLRDGLPAFGWRIGSLLEVIYLQLLDHVRQRLAFGIGNCDFCGAPILRVRRGQRWHSGCAPAGRQRESRAARKLRDQTRGDVEGGRD